MCIFNFYHVIYVFCHLFILWYQQKFANAIFSFHDLDKVKEGEIPFVVAILLDTPNVPKAERLICGGSLIGPDYVLTAAHCFPNSHPSDFKVVVGSVDFTSGKKYDVDYWITYDEWHRDNKPRYHDIDVLKLKNKVDPPVKIGDLSGYSDSYYRGKQAFAVGWGSIRGTKYPVHLKKILLDITNKKDDHFYWSQSHPPAVLQLGDGGSPLLKLSTNNMYKIIGIAAGTRPQIYSLVDLRRMNLHTPVFRYVNFIKDVTNPSYSIFVGHVLNKKKKK